MEGELTGAWPSHSVKAWRVRASARYWRWVKPKNSAQVKSGYSLGAPKLPEGGLTTRSSCGHRKKASDRRSCCRFTTARCRQLLYLPLHSACATS
ncbi:hypothetical protein ACMD2_26304 [Ananas comosus]|uniref:Uncharacterized protein n=1 Tax=Ananas comosus TaxID=4615 RepID=A0A199UWU5_ANACO|nr:hypothetical protein ACMD2_26304 [Ananas comosus]